MENEKITNKLMIESKFSKDITKETGNLKSVEFQQQDQPQQRLQNQQ